MRNPEVVTPATDRVLGPETPMRIGFIPQAIYGGACDVALVLFYNRAISDAERVRLVDWVRSYASRRGIRV